MSDRYQIKSKLGEGGAGAVYRAWDSVLDRTVALKRLLATASGDESERLRKELLREASLLSSIQHPNVCQVYDFGVDEDGGYVVMEFINGEDLEDVARRKVSTEEMCGIAEQVLDAIIAAHSRNVLHRDLKPSNVMINWLPNARFLAKVLDFGLAKFSLTPQQQTIDQSTGTLKGSIYFMAPEQFDHLPLDQRSDLYSLGCLFYYLIANRHPFEGKTMTDVMESHLEHRVSVPLAQIRPDIPEEIRQWIGWLMNRNPDDRPSSSVEALQVLKELRLSLGLPDYSMSIPATPKPLDKTTTSVPRNEPPSGAVPRRSSAQIPVYQPRQTQSVRPNTTTTGSVPHQRATGAVPPRSTGSAVPTNNALPGSPAKKNPAIVIGAGAGIFALLAGGWFLSRDRENEETVEKNTKGSLADLPAVTKVRPPGDGLAIWLDASDGTLSNKGTKPTLIGQGLDHWKDLAKDEEGDNSAIFHTIRGANDTTLLPTLIEKTKSNHGLTTNKKVIQFDGVKTLLILGKGDDTRTGNSFDLLEKNKEMTAAIVALSSSFNETPGRLLAGGSEREPNFWSICSYKDIWFSSIRKIDGSISASIVYPTEQDKFYIIVTKLSASRNELTLRLYKPDGELIQGSEVKNLGTLATNAISEIKLGQNNKLSKNLPEEAFGGDVAEVVIYNRWLSESDEESLVKYFQNKFF